MADEYDNMYAPETYQELGKLMVKMSRNQKHRRPLLKQVKAFDPNYQLPGDMQVQDLREEMAQKDANEKLQAQAQAVKEKLEHQRAGLLDGKLIGRQFDEAQVADIEKLMSKYGVGDYEAGVRIYLADSKPRDMRPTPAGATWTFPDIDGLLDNPTTAARNEANKVINELRGYR